MRKASVMMIATVAILATVWSAPAEQAMDTISILPPQARVQLNRQRFRNDLIQGSFVKWIRATSTSNGYVKSSVNRRWKAQRKQRSHIISQTRHLYVMAQAYQLTRQSKYRAALVKSADFLLRYYAASQDGTWYWQVSSTGKSPRRAKRTQKAYAEAFVMFGLSHAYRVTRDQRYLNAALDTWDNAEALKVIKASRVPFRGYSQNPLMHAFEALLALHDATGIDALLDDAEELGDFVLGKLYQKKGNYIPEKFESRWRPLSSGKGGYVDVGHQFEWAYLLSWAVQKGLPSRYLGMGKKLLDAAMDTGYDDQQGGIFSRHNYQGRVSGGKVSWAQNELLRALVRYASLHGGNDLWAPFEQSLGFVEDYFIDDIHGGWFRHPVARSTSRNDSRPIKGNAWKVDYHVTGMYIEIIKRAR